MYSTLNQITIAATGTALTTFTHASFKVSVQAVKETGPDAKADCKTTIDAIVSAVTDKATQAGILTDQLKTMFKVEPNKVHNGSTWIHQGYRATYTLEFKAEKVEEATAVHDALTSIPFVSAESPQFHVNQEEAAKTAFKDAWDKAKQKLLYQALAVGGSPGDWKLSSWHIEDRSGGGGGSPKMLSATAGEDGPVIEPGRAQLDMTVQFLFERKHH